MKRRGPVCVAFGAFAFAALASFAPGPGSSWMGVVIDSAFAEGAISVGDHLEALSDVSLQRAEIRKGSRVHVTRVVQNQGSTVIDVELPDGHIVKNLSMSQLRSSFRVVTDA